MSEAQVYAFAGKRGSGKSTATEALVEMGFQDVKFAEPLKNMLRELYRTCDVDAKTIERKIEGDLKEVPCRWLNGATPRWAMVKLGTEWRNMISPTLWSDILEKRYSAGHFSDKIVISDWRFPDGETESLQRMGARCYRIDRPGLEEDEISQHPSESQTHLLPIEAVIVNDGSIEDLKREARNLVGQDQGTQSS